MASPIAPPLDSAQVGRGAGRAPYEDSSPLQTVATLRLGQDVDAVWACTRKERQITRTGSPFLTLELRDRTGSIVARAFRDADLLAGRFDRGDLVRVHGRVDSYREQLQIALTSIARAPAAADADLAAFLPTAHRDLDELDGFLEHLAREVYDPGLRGLLDGVLGDRALRAELRRAPCSVPGRGGGGLGGGGALGGGGGGAHHAYLGGLLEHTVAVATMALELCAVHQRLDRDLLLTAAILHDIGKTREFTYGAEIARSDAGRLLGHVQLGLRLLAPHVPPALSDERRLALEHCIVLHHGPDASGGRRFASAEAIALYRLNALDAHLKGAFEQGIA